MVHLAENIWDSPLRFPTGVGNFTKVFTKTRHMSGLRVRGIICDEILEMGGLGLEDQAMRECQQLLLS